MMRNRNEPAEVMFRKHYHVTGFPMSAVSTSHSLRRQCEPVKDEQSISHLLHTRCLYSLLTTTPD